MLLTESSLETEAPIKAESSLDLSISEITSDSDTSCVNFYSVQKAEVYKKENNNTPHLIKYKPSVKYTPDTLQKRHRSESDLTMNFDTPPKVLSQKKDNTLISKIYSQPQVRNFAKNNKRQVISAFVFDSSTLPETARYSGNQALYNSEGEHDRKTLFSSVEDLIEPTTPKPLTFTSTPRLHSVSSEEDLLSEHSGKSGSRHRIYSSTDDLLSTEEHEKPQKKKDNTLIDKIYQNRQVRNYGLASRDYIPTSEEGTLSLNIKDEESSLSSSSLPLSISTQSLNALQNELNRSYNKSVSITQVDESEKKYKRNLSSPDPEIEDIVKRKIVHNLLDKFDDQSKVVPRKKLNNFYEEEEGFDNEDDELFVSVRELRKMFEKTGVSIKLYLQEMRLFVSG